MPIPIIIGVIAGGAALYGAVKGVKGAIDHSDAKDVNEEAKSIVDLANRNIDRQRDNTNTVLEDYGHQKLTAFKGVIADFIEVFEKIKHVDIVQSSELDKLNIGDFSTTTLNNLKNDYQMLMSSGLGLGAGVGSGAALAFGAYNGTMLLATAGTGTAISTLSGVAATNATLAWLGGGTLAAGGGGMALGSMVLGGIVAGPALAIFGHIVGNKGEEALNNANSNLEQAKTIRDEGSLLIKKLIAIKDVSILASNTFLAIDKKLRSSVNSLNNIVDIRGNNYKNFSNHDRELVMRTVKLAQLIKAMIDTPILDKQGGLVLSTEKRLQEIKNTPVIDN